MKTKGGKTINRDDSNDQRAHKKNETRHLGCENVAIDGLKVRLAQIRATIHARKSVKKQIGTGKRHKLERLLQNGSTDGQIQKTASPVSH